MFTDFGLQFFQKELIRLVGPSRKAKNGPPKPSEPASPMPTENVEDENGDKNEEKSTDGKPRKRKPYRPGIGGFLVRSRNRLVSKKQQDEQGNEKKSRKKKSKISDNYPPYIQEAFFGILSQEPKLEVKPVTMPSKLTTTSSNNFIDASEFLSAKTEPVDNSGHSAPVSSTPSDVESNFDDFDSNSIIFLDSDLPERPASEESLEDDFDFFPAFPDDDAIFKEDGVDVNDIFEELEDDVESVDEEKNQPDKSKESPIGSNLVKPESMTPPQL